MEFYFLWRPVLEKMCSYKELFVDEVFTFVDIASMHEALDLQAYDEAASAADAENDKS
jgi:hypothetical protein